MKIFAVAIDLSAIQQKQYNRINTLPVPMVPKINLFIT